MKEELSVIPTVVIVDGERTVYGENYLKHSEKVKQLMQNLTQAEQDDRRSYPRPRVTSSTRLVTSMLDLELEAMVLTNPSLNEEERQKELEILKRMKG